MKTKSAIVLALLFATLARAVPTPLSANFNTLSDQSHLGNSYIEGGITFASSTPLRVATRSFDSTLFGWGATPVQYTTSALYVEGNDWLSITANGQMMTDVGFSMGMDWDGYAIEFGLMNTFFNWQEFIGNTLVASGSTQNGAHFHGGGFEELANDSGFDRLLVSSTAIAYEGILVGGGPTYARGALIGYGNANHIALDDVFVTLGDFIPQALSEVVNTPDHSPTALLVLGALACFMIFLRHEKLS